MTATYKITLKGGTSGGYYSGGQGGDNYDPPMYGAPGGASKFDNDYSAGSDAQQSFIVALLGGSSHQITVGGGGQGGSGYGVSAGNGVNGNVTVEWFTLGD
jgi:hypothetical protein